MRKSCNLIAVLCLGLVLLPQTGYSQQASTAAVVTDDAAAEEKARKFFTDTEVIDQDGNKLRFYSDVLKGRVVLINFIFTNCQDYCPMVTQKLIQTRGQMVETDGRLHIPGPIDRLVDLQGAGVEFPGGLQPVQTQIIGAAFQQYRISGPADCPAHIRQIAMK